MIVRRKYGAPGALAIVFISQTAGGQPISPQRVSKDWDTATPAERQSIGDDLP